jgi:hypothetical protein
MTTSSLDAGTGTGTSTGTGTGSNKHVSARSIDALGLISVAVSAAFLSLALVTENHMGMGIFMGLFISCLVGSLVLFTASRSLVIKCPAVDARPVQLTPASTTEAPAD